MKKLLIFTGHFWPYFGGLESHVEELAKRLSKDYQITIFTSNYPKSKELEVLNPHLRIMRYPAFHVVHNYPMPKFWKKSFRNDIKQLKSEKFDIVMSRTRFFFSSFVAFLFAKKNHIKFVHVEHGSDFVKLGSWWKDLIALIADYTVGWLIISKADISLAISHAVKRFMKRFRKGSIPIITRGVEFEFIDQIKSKNLAKQFPKKIILGNACRLIHWKGVHNALDGFMKLPKETREKCIYLVIGDGGDYQKLKNNYQDPNIKFLGSKSREETIAYMKSFDIYVHSTIAGGGLSNSLLEAMSTNNAILGTPAEGADEVLNNQNSILIKESSPKLFKEGFEQLINNPTLRTKFAKKAETFVRKEFTWDRKIKEYKKLFERL